MITAKLLIENVIIHSGYQKQYYEECQTNENTIGELLSKHIACTYAKSDKGEAFLLWCSTNNANPKEELRILLKERYSIKYNCGNHQCRFKEQCSTFNTKSWQGVIPDAPVEALACSYFKSKEEVKNDNI